MDGDTGRLQVYCGTLVHSTKGSHMQVLEDRAVGVKHGKIVFIEKGLTLAETQRAENIPDQDIYHLPEGWFMMPGLVDCQLPVSPYSFAGAGTDLTAFDWVSQYKQPSIHRMHDDTYAVALSHKLVAEEQTLSSGRQDGVMDLPISGEALRTKGFSEAVIGTMAKSKRQTTNKLYKASLGQRAMVGLEIYMGMHQIDLHETQIDLAEDLVKYIQRRKNKLILPFLNQRWLLPKPLESKLQALQEDYSIPLLTTLSKIPRSLELLEHRDWLELGRSSTQYLWQGGVLNDKTILTHCVHCTEDDLDLIKKKESAVIHCPATNLSTTRGIGDVRTLLSKDIRVGLGSDVGSGSSPDMLKVLRRCVTLSQTLRLSKPSHYRSVSMREAFTLATLGGATALGLENVTGNFEVGKDFDALFIDPDVEDGPFDVFVESDTAEDIIEKFINLGDDRNVKEVYVAGRRVHPT